MTRTSTIKMSDEQYGEMLRFLTGVAMGLFNNTPELAASKAETLADLFLKSTVAA